MEIIQKIIQKIRSKIRSIDPLVFMLWGVLLTSYSLFNLIAFLITPHEISVFFVIQIIILLFGLIIFIIGFKGRKTDR
jgi:hypothetical protein